MSTTIKDTNNDNHNVTPDDPKILPNNFLPSAENLSAAFLNFPPPPLPSDRTSHNQLVNFPLPPPGFVGGINARPPTGIFFRIFRKNFKMSKRQNDTVSKCPIH